MKKLTILTLLVLALMLAVVPASAQASLSTTTLSAAVTSESATLIYLTATTNAVANQFAYVDRELMYIIAVPRSGVIQVQRGASSHEAGGAPGASTHASGATVYLAPGNYFTTYDRSGTCTSTNELVLPVINTFNGNVWNCVSSVWQSGMVMRTVRGTGTLASGSPSTLAVTGMTPPFTSSSTYTCVAQDTTTIANNIGVLAAGYVSGSAVTFTGPNTNTDGFRYSCTGY